MADAIGEFIVNTYKAGDQAAPRVAALSDGGWVVVWQSLNQDNSNWGIYGQRYNSAGIAIGSEFLINSYTADDQSSPSVAALPHGGWVVTWASGGGATYSSNQDGSGYGIYGQRYSSVGVAVGSEFRVNTVTLNDQRAPSVAALPDGGWIITWQSNDSSYRGIYGQRFSSAGIAIGDQFGIVDRDYEQINSTVTGLPDGGWLVTWQSDKQDGFFDGIFGKRYNADGLALGPDLTPNVFTSEFRINTERQWDQFAPSVSALADGGWVVTWTSGMPLPNSGQDGNGYGVYGQRYSSAGAAIGNEFRVNTSTLLNQDDPSVAGLSDGGWVVTWTYYDGASGAIYGQRYSSLGVAVGSEFRVNTFIANNQFNSSVAALPDGGWVVTWQSDKRDGFGLAISSQRYSSDGLPFTDTTAPTVTSIDYGANDGNLALGEEVAFIVALSEDVIVTGTPTLALANGGTAFYVGGTNTNILTFSYTPLAGHTTSDLATASSYALSGTIQDLAVNTGFTLYGNAVIAFDFNGVNPSGVLAVDVAAPTISVFEPSISTMGIAVRSNIVATFSEEVQRGNGLVELRQGSATGTVVESFDTATSSRISIIGSTLTIDPTSDLTANTNYFLVFRSGGFKDVAGNTYAETSIYEFMTRTAGANTVPLVSNTIADERSFEDAAWSYQVPAAAFNDADGDVLIYSATLGNGAPLPTWLSFDAATRTFYGTPPQDFNGDISLAVTASDGSLSTSDTFVLSVTAVNDAPIGFTVGVIGSAVEDQLLTSSVGAIADAEGVGTLAYQWQRSSDSGTTWSNISGGTGESYTLGDADVANKIRLQVSYIDGNGATETAYSPATATIANVNDAPVAASAIMDQSSAEDAAWSYQLPVNAFSDVDGDALTYSAGDPLPAWLTFTAPTRTFSGTPPQDFYGDINLTVTASDGSLSTSGTFALSVTAVNDDPSGVLQILTQMGSVISEPAPEFRVNTYTVGDQLYPAVSALADGGWVVVWNSRQDGSEDGVYGQRYAGSGMAVGSEFRVNTYTLGQQYAPSITSLSDGGWLVTWTSFDQQNYRYSVYGMRYGSSGEAIGGEFLVNTSPITPFGEQTLKVATSSVTALADGGWVVAWTATETNYPYKEDVYGQRFSSLGVPMGNEFRINTTTANHQAGPSMAALADGGWVVTWQSGAGNSEWDVYGQRYSNSGAAIGNEFVINYDVGYGGYTSNDQSEPSVAALADGGWIITWQSYGQDGSSYGIYARRYDSSGLGGAYFRLNNYTAGSQQEPSVTTLADGGWIVTWISIVSGSTSDIYCKRYSSTGHALSVEFVANTYTSGNQGHPSVTALTDGGWIVTWTSDAQDGSGTGVYAQRFDANGQKTHSYTLPDVVATVADFTEDKALYADASLVTDAEGMGPVSWHWQRSSDGGATWSDISGAIGGGYTLGDADVGNLIRLQGTYIDGQGFTNTVYSETSTPVNNVNDAPVVASAIADQSSAEDTAWSYQVPVGAFSDVDGDALSYSATLADGSALPTWLTFNGATRTFSGTPPQDYNGTTSLKVTASDGSLSASDTFVLSIEPPLQIISGTSGNDTLSGVSGNVSEITGGGGNDTIIGGGRADVAVLSGNRSDYTITTVAGVTTVRDNRAGSPDGTDTLKGLNLLRFADIQLFQTTAANKMTLAGQAQTYNVANSQVVQGTNAAEHFIVAPETSALVFAGTNDVVDLVGAIDSYTFTKTGTQLQISDGLYTTTLSVGGSFTLRTASGSTSVAIDFAQGGAIKLGGTQVVGSATFNPLAAILDAGNVPSASGVATLQRITGTSGNDALSGVAGKVNQITGGAGNDTITGGSRADIAVFSGNRSNYTITTLAGVTTVVDNRAGSPDGTDTLKGLNILHFADLQLFQSTAANKMILAGQAQTYNVDNSEVVQGTSAAEHFIVGQKTSALVFAGNNDVVDLSGAIDSYSFTKTGTQLQISDGLYITTLSVGGSFTLRTASGSTSVAIDFTQGGAIKLGGTQVVGSATFDPLAAILDPGNYSDNAEFRHITVKSGVTYNGHAGVADVFVIDASQSLTATIAGFEAGDVLKFTNHSGELGVSVEQAALGDALATMLAGNATINLTALANDNFNNEVSFEAIYGANAIGYVI